MKVEPSNRNRSSGSVVRVKAEVTSAESTVGVEGGLDNDLVAARLRDGGWIPLQAGGPQHLRLDITLENGQVFSWEQNKNDNSVWHGVMEDRVVSLKETPADVWYHVSPPLHEAAGPRFHQFLRQYFNLHLTSFSLPEIAQKWHEADALRLGPICTTHLPGLRLIRQDPFECTIGFICSSNNNIKRIKLMLNNLRRTYGRCININHRQCKKSVKEEGGGGAQPGSAGKSSLSSSLSSARSYYTFPTAEALANATEQELRDLGFGYRAKYVVNSAAIILGNGGRSWLEALRGSDKSQEEVRESLLQLPGVGPKVADCIALFSLDKFACVPIDTHVWQLVEREYKHIITGGTKTLTKRVYAEISSYFLGAFGPYCGWALSFLFAAELPRFQPRLPLSLQLSPRSRKKKKKMTNKEGENTSTKITSKSKPRQHQQHSTQMKVSNNASISTVSPAGMGGGGGGDSDEKGMGQQTRKKKKGGGRKVRKMMLSRQKDTEPVADEPEKKPRRLTEKVKMQRCQRRTSTKRRPNTDVSSAQQAETVMTMVGEERNRQLKRRRKKVKEEKMEPAEKRMLTIKSSGRGRDGAVASVATTATSNLPLSTYEREGSNSINRVWKRQRKSRIKSHSSVAKDAGGEPKKTMIVEQTAADKEAIAPSLSHQLRRSVALGLRI
eukprot:jgi/Bigna1/88593/estExt_fgenesh1_pg.C_340117